MTTISGSRAVPLALLTLVVPALLVPFLASSPADAAATCFGEQATIVASDQDVARGTPGDDVIVASRVFEVSAGAGDDLVCATTTGNRTLSVNTGPGDDALDTRGSGGDPYVVLGTGADRYLGGAADDDVDDGDDGTADRDVILTGGGIDTVLSGTQNRTNPDVIDLGDGDDTVLLAGRLVGSLAGGGGSRDQLSVSGAAPTSWSIDLRSGTTTAGGGSAPTTDVEHVSMYAPFTRLTVRGTTGRNKVVVQRPDGGGTGRLDIDLRGGDDDLSVEGRRLKGRLDVGDGDDRLALVRRGGRELRQDLTGSLATGVLRTAGWRLRVAGVDTLQAKRFDQVHLVGDAASTTFVLSACRTVVEAGGGDDRVLTTALPRRCSGRLGTVSRGQGGDDELTGTAFDDVLVGGAGRDRAAGYRGDDRCRAEVVVGC